jgi:malate dehydrogenase (oxaloacetate-decarboxylating)
MPDYTRPSYSLTIRLSIERKPGMLGRITTAIGQLGGLMGAITIASLESGRIVRDLNVYVHDEDHEKKIVDGLRGIPGVQVLSVKDRAFDYHEGGKIRVESRREIEGPDDLAIAYTPGVARIGLAVADDLARAYKYTMKGNSVAVVTDGTAVPGLGNIGPMGALPVMEGKAVLFRKFAGINAFPLCLNVTAVDAIVSVIKAISPAFGGINLEDISAPRCFLIERRLTEELDIPVFHDDQHGTAIAVLAALYNSLLLVKKQLSEVKIVISGTGVAGIACIHNLLAAGATNITACDRVGVIYPGRENGMNEVKEDLARVINPKGQKGILKEALTGADVFIGVSSGDILVPSDLSVMANEPIVFALANPIPEVDPEGAKEYAAIVATGRSDFPNQINNVLVFPGIFRGALDARARKITAAMNLAAARSIAGLVPLDELSEGYIIPTPFHTEVSQTVAKAVAAAAEEGGPA